MKAYIYDESTKEFLFSDDVDMSPLEKDVILMPPNATLEPINEAKENYSQIFNGTNWEYIEDYRGKTVWKSYNESLFIEELGAIPEGYSLERPEPSEQEQKERIARLSLTKREVFLGLYQAKGVTPDQIKAQITDPAALIEFEYANDYYRGNPLIDIVGAALGITPAQLDKFFETNDYTYLISGADVNNSEELAEENPVVEDITPDENVNNFSEDVNNTEVG